MNTGNKIKSIDTSYPAMKPPRHLSIKNTVCAIDIGSKNVKLVIGENNNGQLLTRMLAKETLHLGRDIRENGGKLSLQKLTDLRQALVRFIEMGRTLGAGQTLAIATNAVRNASNKHVVMDVAFDLGLDLVLAGVEREGVIGYLAATGGASNRIVSELGSQSCQTAWRNTAEIESRAIDDMGYECVYRQFISPARSFNEARNRYRDYLLEHLNNLPDYVDMQYIALASKSMAAFVTGREKKQVIGLRLDKSALEQKISQIANLDSNQFIRLQSTLQKAEKLLPGMIFVDHIMDVSCSPVVLIEEAELPVGLIVEYFADQTNRDSRPSPKPASGKL